MNWFIFHGIHILHFIKTRWIGCMTIPYYCLNLKHIFSIYVQIREISEHYHLWNWTWSLNVTTGNRLILKPKFHTIARTNANEWLLVSAGISVVTEAGQTKKIDSSLNAFVCNLSTLLDLVMQICNEELDRHSLGWIIVYYKPLFKPLFKPLLTYHKKALNDIWYNFCRRDMFSFM